MSHYGKVEAISQLLDNNVLISHNPTHAAIILAIIFKDIQG